MTLTAPRTDARADLLSQFDRVRAQTESLCAPLQPEDYVVQSMPDASPAKWHLAHTTWFWETFLLKVHVPAYQSPHPQYDFLFNSYYNAVGERHCRAQRGQVTRPTVSEVYDYRAHVDRAMRQLIETADAAAWDTIAPIIELGLHHEQQHQELLVTDIKHLFWQNPLAPVYRAQEGPPGPPTLGGGSAINERTFYPAPRGHMKREQLPIVSSPQTWGAGGASFLSFPGDLYDIGHDGPGFAFDNEGPRHTIYLAPFEMGTRLVTNRAWLAFMKDGGYQKPELWLSAGWATVQNEQWNAPLCWWKKRGDEWHEFTLHGMEPVDWDAPVCHVSLYEADAFASWTGARLPTEFEWEVASQTVPVEGAFVESGLFHPQQNGALGPGNKLPGWGARTPISPRGLKTECGPNLPSPGRAHWPKAPQPGNLLPGIDTQEVGSLHQMFGTVWQWTRSQYDPYPGYKAAPGALGEYNGKFMCNQFVLRGGSVATPESHIRRTYRNFFPPDARWQFTGLRLAR